MELLLQVLPIVLYVVAIILIIVLTVVAIKAFKVLDQVQILLKDLEKKSNSLNGVFNVVDVVTNSFTSINFKIAEMASKLISGLYNKYRTNDEEEDIDE